MRKFSQVCMHSLLVLFAFVLFFSCNESVLELPVYQYAKVTKCERDSIKMLMSYGSRGLSEFSFYVHDNLKSKKVVNYSKPGIIICEIDGVTYEIELSNTKGGSRAESVKATINGAMYFSVNYTFDNDNRLKIAQINADGESIYANYFYEGNTLTIKEKWELPKIELSDRDNIGYVCNVWGFAEASSKTAKYVFHPDLYFLNIYGKPIDKLPVLPPEQVVYTEDNQKLSQVGKYYYDY